MGYDTIIKESSFGALKFIFRNSQDYVVVTSFYVRTVPFKVVLQHWQVSLWTFEHCCANLFLEDFTD